MKTFDIKMPKLGESITSGTIMKWNLKAGDTVEEDAVLLEVNTEKVSAEIPSPVAGTLQELLFKEGDVVPVGAVIARISPGNEQRIMNNKQSPVVESELVVSVAKQLPVTPPPSPGSGRWYSPIVLELAKSAGIDAAQLDAITGTGYMGRLTKSDIEDYIAAHLRPSGTSAGGGQPLAPITRPSSPVTNLEDEVKEMDFIRKITAEHMIMSKNTSAHVTSVVEADVTALAHWREKTKDEFFRRQGIKLTFMPAILQATVKALADFPQINVSVDGTKIIYKKHINIGVAVSLDNWNLIVPVVHDADKLSLEGLSEAVDTLAKKARSNKLSPDDIAGGTFTITNFGTFKNIFATPIINQPQVAILGVGMVEKKPAVVETPDGDMIAIRHKMYLSLSYDHRVVDGALGGAFLRRIADYLEKWES